MSLGQCLTEDKCSINGSYDMWTHTILSSWTLNPPTQVKLIILPSSVQAMIDLILSKAYGEKMKGR